MSYAPIILFTYNRPDHTERTLEALSQNTLAKESELYIFCDGPKTAATEEQLLRINATRDVCHSKSWCKNVTVIESDVNKGLAVSIINGVTEIVNKFGKVIVLEDDIVTGKFFLEYMNESLEKYQAEKAVWHITGWRDPVKRTAKNKAFFYPTMDCWGWATWADRWQYFKKDALYYKAIFTEKMKWDLNIEGVEPGMWIQVENNIDGKINTWAIFWYITIYLNKGLCLAPTKSLVKNIGFDNTGVHCGDNECQTITDSIDWKIRKYPVKICVNKREFYKNKMYIKKSHSWKISLFSLIKKLIPLSLKNKLKKILKR